MRSHRAVFVGVFAFGVSLAVPPRATGQASADPPGPPSPYTYYLIHHRWPSPYSYLYSNPYSYPYPSPYAYPYPYPSAYPYSYPYGSGYVPAGMAVPDYYQGESDPGYSYSNMPTTAVLPQAKGTHAVVMVKVPLALADVTFNGEKTTTTGKTRIFTTPELEAGKSYSYAVTANWTEGGAQRTLTRTVQVTPGQTVTVDFTKGK